MEKGKRKLIAIAMVVSAIVLGAYAVLAPALDVWINPGTGLVGWVWLLAFTIYIFYGILSFRMTQGEFGWKQALRLLSHLLFGWVRHWRLVVCLVLVISGLVLIGMSPRHFLTEKITGYRYLLDKQYEYVVKHVGITMGREDVVTRVDFLNMDVDKKTIQFVSGLAIELTKVLKDVELIEIPVKTPVQIWYLDMGYVLAGIALIIMGLIFGLYHLVLFNNKGLQICGEHTARYHVNMLRAAGYEIPEGYEEALAEFYKTGNAEKLKKYL